MSDQAVEARWVPGAAGRDLREKLLLLGPSGLADEELVALVLGGGQARAGLTGPGGSARACSGGGGPLALARKILDAASGLHELADQEAAELARLPGLGLARATRLVAALALGVRSGRPHAVRGRPIRGPEDVFTLFRSRMAGLHQEVFYALMLDAKNRCLREQPVSLGTLSASLVHPREVFRFAVKVAAHSVIVCHNHPSGDPTPSREDREITDRLHRCGKVLGIHLLDHVIVGSSSWVNLGPGRPPDTGARLPDRRAAASPQATSTRPAAGPPATASRRAVADP